MLKPLHWLAAHGTRLMAASVFVGLIVPPLASFMRPAFPVAVFCLLTIALIRVDVHAAKSYLARPLLLVTGVVWMTVATPLVLVGLLWAFDPGPAILLAVVFWAAAPPTFSAPAFSQLLGLNGTFSLAVVLAALLIAPFAIPALADLLSDAQTAVTTLGLMLRLAFLVGGASIVAFIVRKTLNAQTLERSEPVFDGLNVIIMAVIAIAAMDTVTETMIAQPGRFAALVALAWAVSMGAIVLSTLIFWKTGPEMAATFGFANGNRNMALSLGALAGNVPADTWLYFAVAQFPIYLLPLMLKPVYARMLNREKSPASAT